MENLFIKMTQQTPEIAFNTDGNLHIKGVSIPENSHAFFLDAMDWLKNLENALPKTVVLNLDFEYLNTASNRALVEVLKVISKYKLKRIPVEVNWYYETEDDDSKELGEDIESCVDIKFNFITKEG